METFEDVKPGEKLWSSLKGWGTVTTNRDNGSQGYFLGIVFLGCIEMGFYLLDGRRAKDDLFPELFWSEIHFDIPPKPKKLAKKTVEGYQRQRLGDKRVRLFTDDENLNKRWNEQGSSTIKTTLTYEIEE